MTDTIRRAYEGVEREKQRAAEFARQEAAKTDRQRNNELLAESIRLQRDLTERARNEEWDRLSPGEKLRRMAEGRPGQNRRRCADA